MTLLWAVLFALAVLAFWCTNLFGVPGNWLIVAATVLYAWLIPPESRVAIGWPVVAVVTGLAVLGEIMELIASAAGVKKVGGSRLGAVLALFGSVAGAIVGIFVGMPIPVIGSMIAALLFAGLGALVGAMLGETIGGKSLAASWKVGQAAFWGRLIGTFAKALIGAVMAGTAIAALFV
ncbi:MAG: DUF456 domain-containing protein [Gemmataceae bacterium]